MSISATSSSKIQTDYMKLLVTQLQNQNPLEPMDNDQMASQLTQFSQLEQLESMKSSFSDVLKRTENSYATSLLGKRVTFYATNEVSGELETKVGTVDSVLNDPETGENKLGLTVDTEAGAVEYTLGLNAVVLVQN
ncbi:MAG: hypothetical protein B6I36_10105 [Desulfobacteraceae bacterium 4572_35.1]|nr:MAG: hypothetical protein B6I36_10105 [Desulfobacteraceae bacterium 4572_35.1]